MNRDDLENAVRATLRENVDHVRTATLATPDLSGHRVARRGWLAPVLASAAVVVVAVGVALAVARPWADDAGRSVAGGGPTGRPMSSVPAAPTGTWRLTSTATGGKAVSVPTSPNVTIVFHGATAVVNDGVNSTVLTVEAAGGVLTARFRSTTYVLDGHANDAARHRVLQTLDALAPSTTPHRSTKSHYTLAADRLVITTGAGQLVLTR